jgi:hypothetical protein
LVKLDRLSHEAIWFAVTACASAALAFISASALPTEWGPWLLALAVATARPLFGLIVNVAPTKQPTGPQPPVG